MLPFCNNHNKIFQGDVVAQTVLGGLTMRPPVATFQQLHVPKIMRSVASVMMCYWETYWKAGWRENARQEERD